MRDRMASVFGVVAAVFLLGCASRTARGDLQLGIEAETNGSMRVQMWGSSNAFRWVQVSSNLVEWSAWTNVFSPFGIGQALDHAATGMPVRFYRAAQAPFNGAPLFNLTTGAATNPSAGCEGDPVRGRGIDVDGGKTDPGLPVADVPGLAHDSAHGLATLHNGELVHSATDMEVASRGFPWKLERTYRSGISFVGPMGCNWDFNYNRRLVVDDTGDVLRMDGHARTDRYTLVAPNTYQSPRGCYTKLVKNPDGSFTERDRHGNTASYAAPDGQGLARLSGLGDRNGNTMTFVYDAQGLLTMVRDTFGREYGYAYDALGRIVQVEDFTGRRVTYAYDTNGMLETATSPPVTGTPTTNDFPSGKTMRYTYSSKFGNGVLNNNLLTITAPNEVASSGPPWMVASYVTNEASPHMDRLERLVRGGVNAGGVPAGGTNIYSYAILGSAPSNDYATAVIATTVTDGNGNQAEYWFNRIGTVVRLREFSNRDVRPTDPAYWETVRACNSDGEVTNVLRPQGNSIEYVYDSANPDRFQQGNLLRVRLVPDLARGGDQPEIVTTMTYEPLFNRPATLTDPRGNDAGHVPPNGGTNSQTRYTVRFFYDWQESASAPTGAAPWGITIPPELLGLGDLNDDGSTNGNSGNMVRREDPAANLLPGSNQALAEGDTTQDIVTRYVYNAFGQIVRTEDARGNTDTVDYFPANDPDGDGLDLIAGGDPSTGGYLKQTVRDAIAGPRRLDTAPLAAVTNRFLRDYRGNATAVTDGRGNTRTYTLNALDQVVQEEAPKVDPGQAHGYLTRYYYDASNNRIGTDIENWTTDTATHRPLLVSAHTWFQHRAFFDILGRVVESVADATRDAAIPPCGQPESLVTRYRYDANGNLVRTDSPLAVAGTEPFNRVTAVYDERDLVYSRTRGDGSPQSATFTYDYDPNGNAARWTDAEDNGGAPGPESEEYVYDGFDRLCSVTNRGGGVRMCMRDAAGHIVREDMLGRATPSATTNVLLARVAVSVDEAGRVYQQDRALFLPAGVTQQVSTLLVDGPLTPADGNVTARYEYDALGRRTFTVEDSGATFRLVYDGADRVVTNITPLVDTVTAGGPHPTRTAFSYDANGNVTRRVDTHTNPEGLVAPTNETTLYVYDALDRRVRVTDALGQTGYAEYDSRGYSVAAYDARGPLIADPLGLYSGLINSNGNVTRFAYDGAGRRWREQRDITTTGNGGSPIDTSNPFNADGLIVTLSEYDANSRLVARTDDILNRTAYAYDSLNRLVAQTNADGGSRQWQFDRDGQLTALTDENATAHTFASDALGRRTLHALAPDGTKTNAAGLPMLVGTTLQTYEYDGLSRLVRATDNNEPLDPADDSTLVMRYDSLGRLTEEVQDGRTVSSGYSALDRVDLHYPDGRVVHHSYDAMGRMLALSNRTSFAWSESPLGAPAFQPGHTVLSYVRASGCQSSYESQASTVYLIGSICSSATLTPSGAGYVSITVTAGSTCGGGSVPEYRFLSGYRVSGQTNDSVVVTQNMNVLRLPTELFQRSPILAFDTGYESFNRDRNNGITSFQRLSNGGSTTNQLVENNNLSLDSLGRQTNFSAFLQGPDLNFTSMRRQKITGAVDVPEVRDNANMLVQAVTPNPTHEPQDGYLLHNGSPGTGIRTADTNFVYQWDGLNRLRTVRQRSTTNLIAVYAYDASPAIFGGRRVQKAVTNAAAFNGTMRFYYDGPNCIEEAAVAGGATNLARQTIFGGGADEQLAMDVDTNSDGVLDQLYFLMHDHNNNVTQLVDTNGRPQEAYFYDYRGAPRVFNAQTGREITNSPAGNPWLFTGQRYDPETRLYYYKARYYDPVYGVFLSRDSMGAWHDGGNFGNGMAYAGLAPFSRRDPSGLKASESASEQINLAGRNLDIVKVLEKYFGKLGGRGEELTGSTAPNAQNTQHADVLAVDHEKAAKLSRELSSEAPTVCFVTVNPGAASFLPEPEVLPPVKPLYSVSSVSRMRLPLSQSRLYLDRIIDDAHGKLEALAQSTVDITEKGTGP